MLISGASALYPSAYGGAFTFVMNGIPSDAWWDYGSEHSFDMLFAGVAVNFIPSKVGALSFNVDASSRWADWDTGSAII